MNIDIRLSLEFFDHPKTKKLRKRLGTEAVFCLLKIWTWTAGNRPGGVLTGLDAEAVELVADWGGEEGALVAALCELRLLEENGGVFAVHDWEDHQAYASRSEERSSKARKAAEARWNRAAEVSVNTDSDAQGMLNDATSNAKNMLSDATSMPDACYRQCPRNQEPVTRSQDINTHTPQDSFNNINTRARALELSRGEVCVGEGSSPEQAPFRDRPKTDAPSKGHPQWPGFLSCWEVYPVKQGKEAAWREWMRLHENRTLAPAYAVREAILRLNAEDSRWRRGMAPKMDKWLYGKGWEDEPYMPPGAEAVAEATVDEINAQAQRAADERRRTFAALREESERMRYGGWTRQAATAAGGVQ